jgi:hypothetical protein
LGTVLVLAFASLMIKGYKFMAGSSTTPWKRDSNVIVSTRSEP